MFTPIRIRYNGIDASYHQIDLNLLGQSLQGASRLIAVAGHIAVSGEYVSRLPAMSIRVLAQPPQAHCFDLQANIQWATSVLPMFVPITGKVVENIVSFFLKKFGAPPSDSSKALDVALASIAAQQAAVDANKVVATQAIDAMKTALLAAANDQRPAARNFASPVGTSVSTAMIGETDEAFVVDEAARKLIDLRPKATISPTRSFTVFISELDTQTGHGKVAIQGVEDDKRFSCTIVDPIVFEASSPYSTALDKQTWLKVNAKAHLDGAGEIERLTISDTL